MLVELQTVLKVLAQLTQVHHRLLQRPRGEGLGRRSEPQHQGSQLLEQCWDNFLLGLPPVRELGSSRPVLVPISWPRSLTPSSVPARLGLTISWIQASVRSALRRNSRNFHLSSRSWPRRVTACLSFRQCPCSSCSLWETSPARGGLCARRASPSWETGPGDLACLSSLPPPETFLLGLPRAHTLE